MKKQPEITSHFAFSEHWNELPEYAGYVPKGKEWESVKDEFYMLFKHSDENPKFLILQKGEENISVYVYGFKVPYTPSTVDLCADATTKNKVALCKTVATKECVAIAW